MSRYSPTSTDWSVLKWATCRRIHAGSLWLSRGTRWRWLENCECPSHGIRLTPDDRELWVADGVDNRLHVFDATTYPPVAATTIEVRAQPRWVTFGIDGKYAYPSTGDVIDRELKKVVWTAGGRAEFVCP